MAEINSVIPSFTPNLDLIKPHEDMDYDVLDFNGNADKVDFAFGEIKNDLAAETQAREQADEYLNTEIGKTNEGLAAEVLAREQAISDKQAQIEYLNGQVDDVRQNLDNTNEALWGEDGFVPTVLEALENVGDGSGITVGGHKLLGSTIVDVVDGKPVLREDGSGDWLLCVTFLGVPYLRDLRNIITDTVTGIKFSFTIADGNVIVQQTN